MKPPSNELACCLVVHHAEGKGSRKPQMWRADLSGDKLLLAGRYGS